MVSSNGIQRWKYCGNFLNGVFEFHRISVSIPIIIQVDSLKSFTISKSSHYKGDSRIVIKCPNLKNLSINGILGVKFSQYSMKIQGDSRLPQPYVFEILQS
jgi:hypothetical protein